MFGSRGIFLVDILVNAIAAILLLLFVLSPLLQSKPPAKGLRNEPAHLAIVTFTAQWPLQGSPLSNVTALLEGPGSTAPFPMTHDDHTAQFHAMICGENTDMDATGFDVKGAANLVAMSDELGLPSIECTNGGNSASVYLPSPNMDTTRWHLRLVYADAHSVDVPEIRIQGWGARLDGTECEISAETSKGPSSQSLTGTCGDDKPEAQQCKLRPDTDVVLSWVIGGKCSGK